MSHSTHSYLQCVGCLFAYYFPDLDPYLAMAMAGTRIFFIYYRFYNTHSYSQCVECLFGYHFPNPDTAMAMDRFLFTIGFTTHTVIHNV